MPLEPRVMLSGVFVNNVDLGTVSGGRIFMTDQTLPVSPGDSVFIDYNFTYGDQKAQPGARADLDVAFSVPQALGHNQDVSAVLADSTGNIIYAAVATTNGHGDLHFQIGSSFAYTLQVSSLAAVDISYSVGFEIDPVPGAYAAGSTANFTTQQSLIPDDTKLRAAQPSVENDFIGYVNSSNAPGFDAVDAYRFTVPASGLVTVSLDQLVADQSGGKVSVNYELVRDLDNDGILESNEVFLSRSNISSSASGSVNLSAGDYYVVITSNTATAATGVLGGSNYRLRVFFAPPDNAGSTVATAHDFGTIGGPQSTQFIDYISPSDATDVYKFTTVAGGPFEFTGTWVGTPFNAAVQMDLYRDSNGNGLLESSEKIATASTPDGHGFGINTPLTVAGTYYLVVTDIAQGNGIVGESPYTLFLTNLNTDVAGNTYATAHSIGDLYGITGFADFVSPNDPIDIYRFNLPTSAVVSLSFPALAGGTDAGLELLQDLNNDGVLDKGDVIAPSDVTGNGGESIKRSLNAGTYYVAVYQKVGSPSYRLNMEADIAPSAIAGAPFIDLNGPGSNILDYIGPDDPTDIYRMNVTSPVQLNTFVSLIANTVTVTVGRDLNHNGIPDPGEAISITTLTSQAATADNHLSVNLTQTGSDYFLMITSAGGAAGTDYGLVQATAPVNNAGTSLANAPALNLTAAAQVLSDYVGTGAISDVNNFDDYYKFTVGTAGPYEFVAQTPFVAGSIGLQLIRDANNDQQVQNSEIIATTVSPVLNSPTPPIVLALTQPGTYYVHVFRFQANSNYGLSLQLISLDAAGNSIAQAKQLTLSTNLTASDFIGLIDQDDFYQFSTKGATNVTAFLANADPLNSIEIIQDTNGNSIIDPGETIATTLQRSGNGTLAGVYLPNSGIYYLRVRSNGGTSNYTLNLLRSLEAPFPGTPFSIDPTIPAGTTIQVEDFNNGGEGLAYHDTTPGNAGGSYRVLEGPFTPSGVDIFPTADSGGGFRVDADAGEFLDYTVNVAASGTYNISFRTGTTGSGAKFDLEVDGANVTGSLSVPGGLPADTFATVTAPNVVLASGPHMLRLVFDSANTIGTANAGSFNFITIAPSTGAGIATLPSSPVPVNQQTNLSLQWTVPLGDWHLLDHIDIRLTDAAGDLILVRFDEATQTLSLYNPRSGKFGPAKKIGSNGELTNGLVSIDLSASRLAAAGPTFPTVTINLALTFLNPLAGQQILVETAATNDQGFVQAFDSVGTIQVN